MAVPKRTGRGKNALNKRSKAISAKVSEMAKVGVPTRQIYDHIFVNFEATAPTSFREFQALYGPDINSSKAETSLKIGKKIVEQATAEEGHFPSQALFLETQGGWNKKQEVDVSVDVDEDTSGAISTIMSMLGKNKDTDKEE